MTRSSLAAWRPSPNFWNSRFGYHPQYIVLHGTDGPMPGCLDWLTSPESGASVHYLVSQIGAIFQLVDEDAAAWGNGIPEPPSIFCQHDNPNWYTISIEHERWNANTTPITDAQAQASRRLIADIRTRWGALPLLGHNAISPQSRAQCPGPGFPWALVSTPVGAPTQSDTTWVRFTAKPQRFPLVFYADASTARPLYVSAATVTTTLLFDAWRDGPPMHDPVTKALDARWYHRYNPIGQEGWVPSAWVDRNAPDSRP